MRSFYFTTGIRRTLYLLLLIMLIQYQAFSQQQVTFHGKVTQEETNNPLEGVTVAVKGKNTGTTTDANGSFSLSVEPGTTLVFRYIGYVEKEITTGAEHTINVQLALNSTNLGQVVVVGYGTESKATLTGSVASVKGDEVRSSPATNITNTLAGRLPGLDAVQTSGEPGNDDATLRIRGLNTLGNNSPLIVVDGIANRTMNRLDPADIESITVLKDAMAAIYGAQAANGVILITTKRGKAGKPTISLNLNAGLNQPTRIPKMANAAQYTTMLNEIAYYSNPAGGRNQKYAEEDIQKYSDGSDPWGHPNTNWFKDVLKPWSSQTYENLSMSGGSERLRYFLSVGTRYDGSYYKHGATNFSQYDFRSNIDGKISNSISVSFDVAGHQFNYNYPNVDATTIWRSLMRAKPTSPAYWPDGSPGPDLLEFGDQPAVIVTDATGYNRNRWYQLETNANITIVIPWIKGLSVQGNLAIDKGFQFQKVWATPWYLYSWDGNEEHTLVRNKVGPAAANLTQYMSNNQNITLNAYATYEPSISDKHHLKIMAGTERQSGNSDVFNAHRQNYLSTQIDQLFAGASDQYMTNSGSASQSARLNYFGRVNYDYARKYLLDFVWRDDGSYIFPKGKRFGFFPGISGGWRISEENFWNINFLNDFKLRASWGQTGNDRVAEYQYLSSYGFQSNPYILGVTNQNPTLDELRIPNPDITWEVANQSNFGFDAQLLKGKLSVSADYFINIRSRILIAPNASVPAATGLSLPLENLGKVSNRGFEGVVSYQDQAGKFSYNISVNGSFAKNRIVFWDETPGIPDYQKSTGRPIGSSLYYVAIGVFKDQAAVDAYPHWPGARPGDVIFKDVNGDNKIDGLDMVMNEKSSMPRLTGGLNINLSYGQFDLAVLFQGATGSVMYIHPESGEVGNYYEDFVIHRWTPENPSSTYPRTFDNENEYWRNQPNTYWLKPTDYLRLKNIEIGYTLPAKANKSVGIQSLRIYVNGSNIFTVDKEKLIDPESIGNQLGIPYPLQRIVNAGLTLTF